MKKGFTLVEIMIVVAIIAILVTISIPAFIQYRKDTRTASCRNNLRLIQNAKIIFSLKGGLGGTDPVTIEDCQPYIKNGATLSCPEGGTYACTTTDSNPTCSEGGEHVLQ